MDTAAFDTIAPNYDNTRGGEPRGERFADHIARYFPPQKSILELGVGTGLVGGALRRLGFPIVGIDISQGMLQRARPRVAHLVYGNIGQLPFEAGVFSGAYAIWVMHMVSDLSATLAGIKRVLCPGGHFLTASVVHKPSPDPVSQLTRQMQVTLLGQRSATDVPSQLEALAAQAGFDFEGLSEVRQSVYPTPNSVAGQIAAREYSYLQQVTDEQWRDVVEPTIAALKSFPNPDKPVERQIVHELTILRSV